MKPLLGLSVLANCILLVLVFWPAKHNAQPQYPRIPRMNIAQRGATLPRMYPSSPNSSTPTAPWDWVESRDNRKLIANLRALGCPEQTIRDLITMRVCRQYHDQLLAAQAETFRSWNFTRNRTLQENQRSNQQQSQLRAEMETELERLLQVPVRELQAAVLGWPPWSANYDFLSLEKQGQLRELNQRYQTATSEARMGLLPWEADPEADARVAELKEQKQAELARLFTPEELRALNLRDSPAAQYVREYLPEAKSSAEFEQMVDAAQSVGIEKPSSAAPYLPIAGAANQEQQREYAEKKARLEEKLDQVLGRERVTEQQQEEQARQSAEAARRAQQMEDEKKAMLVDVGKSVGLGTDEVSRFFDRMKEVEPALDKKFQELSKSLEGNPDREKAMQAAVKEELEKIAVEVLGDKGPAFVQKLEEQFRKQ